MCDDRMDYLRERVARCRRLLDYVTDEQIAAALRNMAEEGELDIKRLEAERRKGRG